MLKLDKQSGHAVAFLLIIVVLLAIGSAGYFVYKAPNDRADSSSDNQPVQNTQTSNSIVPFESSPDHVKSDSLNKVGDFAVDGNKITVLVAIGGPVGCEDKILKVNKETSELVFNIQATSRRTKIYLPIEISAVLNEPIDSSKVKINLIKKCQ